jgi:hypothetical protein
MYNKIVKLKCFWVALPCWSGPCALPVERPRRRWSSRRFAFVILNIKLNLQNANIYWFFGDRLMRGIWRTVSWDGIGGLCHETDCADCVMRRIQQTVSWDGLGGPCHEMDWPDSAMGWIGRTVTCDGLDGLWHEMDWAACVMKWIGRIVSWDRLGGLCHAMDWADCVMRLIRQTVSWDGFSVLISYMKYCFLIVSTPNLCHNVVGYPASIRTSPVLKPDKHLFIC